MATSSNATLFSLSVWYADSDCDGTPFRILISESTTCNSNGNCLTGNNAGSMHLKTVCTPDIIQSVEEIFGHSPYLLKASCDNTEVEVFIASGNCEGLEGSSAFAIATLHTNGSAALEIFSSSTCSNSDVSYSIDRDTISSHECDNNHFKWYSGGVERAKSLAQETDSGTFRPVAPLIESTPVHSGLSTAAIIGIGVGSVMVIVLIFQAILCCRRRTIEKPIESHLHPLVNINSIRDSFYIQHREATGLRNDYGR